MGALALIEVLDRDGSVRHARKVLAWPLRVGRSLESDLVLDDPHVAGHHFTLDANDDGVFLAVGDTVNGVAVGGHRLAAGERWQAADVPSTIVAGRTSLRLRLAAHALAPEAPLVSTRVLAQGAGLMAVLVVLNLLMVAFGTYLASDPEPLPRSLATALLGSAGIVLAWCGVWTLLSKLFTRQGHFAWHLRVALTASLAVEALEALLSWAGFAFSWPWATGYLFVGQTAVGALTLYFHLLAVEPHRPRVAQGFAAGAFTVALGLLAWGHWQRYESPRGTLYQSVMFPPGWRVARPVSVDEFLARVQPLEARLDEQAGKAGDPEGGEGGDDDE